MALPERVKRVIAMKSDVPCVEPEITATPKGGCLTRPRLNIATIGGSQFAVILSVIVATLGGS